MTTPIVRAVDAPLATARLSLRAPSRADCSAIATLANNVEVARWLERLPHPYSDADARYFVDVVARDAPVWGIHLAGPETFMGVIGINVDDDGTAPMLGFWLGEPFWGCGYTSEAAIAVLDAVFGRCALPELAARYLAGNARSAGVLRKLGFVETGEPRVTGAVAGSTTGMTLSARDWSRRRAVLVASTAR